MSSVKIGEVDPLRSGNFAEHQYAKFAVEALRSPRRAFPTRSQVNAIIKGGFPPASRRIPVDKASKLSYGSQNPGVGGQARP